MPSPAVSKDETNTSASPPQAVFEPGNASGQLENKVCLFLRQSGFFIMTRECSRRLTDFGPVPSFSILLDSSSPMETSLRPKTHIFDAACRAWALGRQTLRATSPDHPSIMGSVALPESPNDSLLVRV